MIEGKLQVRYAHKGFDLPLQELGVKPATDDGWIKQALAKRLVVPLDWLNEFVVERHQDGNVTLREVA
jgi:hypothetical protein